MDLKTVLPEDLLNEILLHVPVKSLARFKCVSKQWDTLISSRCFIKTVLERYPEPNNMLLTLSCFDVGLIYPQYHNGDVTIKQHDLPSRLWLVGAYHGLICFSSYRTGDAYVWNPLTNQRSTIGFDQSLSNNCNTISHFGFGFDAINDYYKVVKVSKIGWTSCSLIIEICQFKNNEARVKVLPPVEVPFKLSFVKPVTINGSSHWIAFHLKHKILQIVRFDMNDEKFLEIPFSRDHMPKIHYENFEEPCLQFLGLANDDGLEFSLGVFKETLCLFVSDPDTRKLEAWSMNCKNHDHNGFVWTKIFEVQLKYMIEQVFGFTADNKVVLNTFYDGHCFYDPWKDKYVFPVDPYDEPMDEAVAYVESFVPVPPH